MKSEYVLKLIYGVKDANLGKLWNAWATGINARKPDAILPLLTENFYWPTAIRSDEVDGILYSGISNWCLTSPVESNEYESTICDCQDYSSRNA